MFHARFGADHAVFFPPKNSCKKLFFWGVYIKKCSRKDWDKKKGERAKDLCHQNWKQAPQNCQLRRRLSCHASLSKPVNVAVDTMQRRAVSGKLLCLLFPDDGKLILHHSRFLSGLKKEAVCLTYYTCLASNPGDPWENPPHEGAHSELDFSCDIVCNKVAELLFVQSWYKEWQLFFFSSDWSKAPDKYCRGLLPPYPPPPPPNSDSI